MAEQNKYIPGVCNIGPAEIKKRKQGGWAGLVVTAIFWALFIWFNVPHIFRLIIFFPALMSAIGFLQARMHFCVHFGFSALFNFGEVGKTDTVMEAEFRAMDRKKAWQITVYSAIAALAAALIAYAI